MNDDAVLLHRYAAERDESAFAELVQRHLPLVYGAALRQLNGATHRAEEVTQAVGAAAKPYTAGSVIHDDGVDWAAVDAQARMILSDAQFALFRSVEPHGGTWMGLRYHTRLDELIDQARAADAANTTAPTAKLPGG